MLTLLISAVSQENELLWHRPTAQLPCESSLAVDAHDSIVVVDGTGVSRLSARGSLQWRQNVTQTPDDFALASKLSRVGVAVSPKWAKENPARGAAEKEAMGNET